MDKLPWGVRASLPLALPTLAVGLSFGLLAAPHLGALATIAMSALVWSGTAQFAAIGVLAGGSGVTLAAGSGLLANARFLPMGFAVAPSTTGRAARRAAAAVALADPSFAIGHRDGGRFDVGALVWAAPVQYVSWVGGTAAGVLGGSLIGDPARFGLDALFPVFYLSVLAPELLPRNGTRPRFALLVAGLASALALLTTPLAPAGVPILVAAAAALLGLARPWFARFGAAR